MDTLLLNLFAFLRPIMFTHAGIRVAGLSFFELAGILLGLLLLAMLSYRATVTRQLYASSVDVAIVLFSFWCVAVFFIYIDESTVEKVVNYSLPLLTFIVAKNIITEKQQFQQLLFLFIAGFAIPVAASSVLIALGGGLQYEQYWTGELRYEGVYDGAHNLGHNVTFMIMLIVIYVTLRRSNQEDGEREIGKGKRFFMGALVVLGLYCLYQSRLRTAIVGLILFTVIYLFYFNKRMLILGMTGLLALSVIFAPIVISRFVGTRDGEIGSANEIFSGRLENWTSNLTGYVDLPIDRKLAGNGIGNELDLAGVHHDTHNDVLGVIADTGLVGFILYMLLQLLILRKILELEDNERHVFLALFVAVFAMNFGSNSYISRFGLAQCFYLLIAYVDLPSVAKPALSSAVDRRIPVSQT